MKKENLLIKSIRRCAETVFEMKLLGASSMQAGQFVEIEVPPYYLRRPISVADYKDEELTLLIKEVGVGTETMARWSEGKEVSLLTQLGNSFNVDSKKPLLIGGGIGCAPLYMLARLFSEKGIRPTAVLGFASASDVYYKEEFKKVADLIITTDDGSYGMRGNVLDAIKWASIDFDRYYACGPVVMLKAVSKWSTEGQVSLEARMGCGFGACMGCSIKTLNGPSRVCTEGPVFEASEIIWE